MGAGCRSRRSGVGGIVFFADGVDELLRDAARSLGKTPIPKKQVKALVCLAMSLAHVRYGTVHGTLKCLRSSTALGQYLQGITRP
ncbi:MAG: hypothetical protein OXC62_00610 [Aestuariivita sp.]|nr:hypothetical protein [Aestuariivita sp.]